MGSAIIKFSTSPRGIPLHLAAVPLSWPFPHVVYLQLELLIISISIEIKAHNKKKATKTKKTFIQSVRYNTI